MVVSIFYLVNDSNKHGPMGIFKLYNNRLSPCLLNRKIKKNEEKNNFETFFNQYLIQKQFNGLRNENVKRSKIHLIRYHVFTQGFSTDFVKDQGFK